MERVCDIVFSCAAIVIALPILIPLAVALRLTGEGEVFYRQIRVGKNGKQFGLLKFATMLKDSPNIGAGEVTLRNDPRILPLGQFLRKTKLNELPQLINILWGDMSFVGPRPMVPSTFANYPEASKDIICGVSPGLTGIGSIVFRDEEQYLNRFEDSITFYREVIIPYKAELECWYVAHRSLGLYFKIIFLTAYVVVFPGSSVIAKVLPGLPTAPDELQE